MADFLSISSCVASTDSMLLLGLLPVVALVMIGFGIVSRVGFFGVFGSIGLFVFSWYLSPCVGLLAFIVAGFSLITLLWFALGSGLLGASNDVFK